MASALVEVAHRLGRPTHPGAPFWSTPCAHLWAALDAARDRDRGAWERAVTAACLVANRIPAFAEGTRAVHPSDVLPWLDSPRVADADKLAAIIARGREADKRERAKAARQAAPSL